MTSLAEAAGLSQSVLSQHLAKPKDQKIIAYRRESQTLWYRIARPRIQKLFAMLHGLFCRPPKKAGSDRPEDRRPHERLHLGIGPRRRAHWWGGCVAPDDERSRLPPEGGPK